MSSDRTAQRLSRILAMLPWIIGHDGAEVDDLVERFDYRNRADLVKDLHLVFMTGLPGYGPGDLIDVDVYDDEVYVDAADYFSKPLRLTAPQALGLLAAGMTFIGSDQAPEALTSAVEKLTVAIVPDASSLVHFDVPAPDSLRVIRDAIDQRRVIEITYLALATNERTVREVEASSVFFNLGNWYLTGYCRLADAERTFRVDRIESIVTLDSSYKLDRSGGDGVVRYRASDSDAHVSFTVTPESRWVSEYYPVDADELENGCQRITMSVSDPLVAARLLIRLGGAVSDIDGDDVTHAMDGLRSRIRARYQRTR
jgi:predicted DNA-binding transcriptional regulator YafY